MADIKDLEEKRTGVSWLNPRIIKVKEGLNSRNMIHPTVVAHIEDLAASIAVQGVLTPLEVFSNRGDPDIYVAHGHCRLAATMLAIERGAEIDLVPCVIEPSGINDVARKLRQIPANVSSPLSLLDAGEAIKYAIAKGWTREKIATSIGKSLSYVAQALEFQGADAEIHASVRAGEISATTAAAVIREVGPTEAPAVVREAVGAARAAGKKKATAANIKPIVAKKAVPLDPHVVCFQIGDVDVKNPSSISQEISITIKGVVHVASKVAWNDLAEQILAITKDRIAA